MVPLSELAGAGQASTGEERDASCPEHGAFKSRNIIGKVWSRCPECQEAERVATHEREEAKARAEAQAKHEALIGAAAIPARFVGKSFANFTATTDEQRRALTIARDYAEQFKAYAKRGKGLILSGQPGTGKSHLAGAILQSLLSPHVRYATCMDIIRMVRETWRKDSAMSESQVLAYLGGLDLLVIDEMGVQYGTEGEQTVLFDVLDRRYREVRPTILLTNQDSEGLKGYLGERTFDRLRETCKWVAFEWESYRPTARKEAHQ